jgi:LDH2 family malate/lactate/ureidoglycolate dehydrogenase
MRGVHTHGLDLLPFYWRGLKERLISPDTRPEIVHTRGCVGVVDGGNGLGYETSRVAMELACQLADEMGVGVVTARETNHFGMAGHWPLQALESGKVGFATTNGPPIMAAWGGGDVGISNNPFAWGIPAGQEFPILFDAACSESARGKIRLAAAREEPIPDTWALDSRGAPTTDARAALDGALRPFAGAKGSGIAIVNEILSSAFSGARVLTEIAGMSISSHVHDSWRHGHFFMALDVDAFESRSAFLERVDTIVGRLRQGVTAPGHERVALPGQRGFEAEQDAEAHGVIVSRGTDARLRRFADHCGIAVTW